LLHRCRIAGSCAILALAALLGVEFALLLRAEWKLHEAVQAGAVEASLPRATRASVAQVVARRLQQAGLLQDSFEREAPFGLSLSIERNGASVGEAIDAEPGDVLTVAAGIDADGGGPRFSRWFAKGAPSLLFARGVAKKR
jgi:hypothetical protein